MNSGLIGTSTTCLKIKTSARTYIVQWGKLTSNTPQTVTFPQAFTTTPIVTATRISGTHESSVILGTTSKTSVLIDGKGYNNNQMTCLCSWLAIGY